ncbi:MAG: transglutaminase family protein [Geminicoccaceae bacterium]
MVMHVALNHKTVYRYDRPVHLAPQIVRLRPAPHCRTRILSYSLKVHPEKHFINWQQDPHSNYLARFVFPDTTRELSVEVDLVAEMAVLNPFDFFLEPAAEKIPFAYEPLLRKDLEPFLEAAPVGPLLKQWLATVPREPTPTVDFLVALNQRLWQDTRYTIRLEPGIQTPEETLSLASGSCRDSAWLLVQILRNLGLAARFVSGYLIQLKPDVKALDDGPSGAEADFTDLHAWTEVFLPGAGWIGLDPTSGLLAGEGHLPLAATPDPQNAAPITGLVDPCEVEFGHEMSVRRIFEQPRVTLPYDDATWNEVLEAGRVVDRRLWAGDVRLTVGGEPTFVSIDDRDGAEWNTAAVGPMKRGLADDLIKRLQARFAPGGLLHHGQGKWYPGEQLPRWSFALYWRGDGQPMWRNPALIADETPPVPVTLEQVERFSLRLTERLGVDTDHLVPAFEDPAHFLLKEHLLPDNVDPSDSKLDDPQERARLARVFDRGLDVPSGFVLPIQRWQSRDRRYWRSDRWATRRGKLFLIPGDSPVGFRLPLGSLPYVEAGDYPHVYPMDPFAARAALPASTPVMQERLRPAEPGQPFTPTAGIVRTALAIEPRDGHVCLFLPPLESVDDFVEMITAIEDTATALSLPVRLEGYPPPPDYRLNVIKVTPDPGVIEVNIQPSHSWDEQVAITEALYEEARLARLDTCKFQLDGRQTGTGGGNHVVIGGATPADSPFLRRPDLLASLIAYWQNHPSLSYLFSGLFIGPTSQAPRLDEARQDQLYEMDIALRQIPDPPGPATPPWLVDRIFRDLLIDVSGNTHRAEICIDKLYNPEGPTGRLGLVEFRAFEMPPHARMSLAQQLVLRALIAWFWERPYRRPLIRFGTALHDRYMLPHYVWRDFCDVLEELRLDARISLKPEWFNTHFEFRFPLCGEIAYRDVQVELRAALEPWHVMGEEGTVGGTARYVDSSLERLQVKVTGAVGPRYTVTCNRRELPLQPAGINEALVAGVRFRAWQPPHCLHPTIGLHTPLIFDVVDRWNGRSVGGCTYHVMHPAGRNFETLPINDFEAEGRRLARFQPWGHTPGPFAPLPADPHPEFPHTLDLRRFG